MFLTNNYRTTNSLMIYSKGKYVNKIIAKYSTRMDKGYRWIKLIQSGWDKTLKNKEPNIEIDYTMMPFGNANGRIYLKTDTEGIPKLFDFSGEECF